jgi:hypothetical protein
VAKAVLTEKFVAKNISKRTISNKNLRLAIKEFKKEEQN